MTKILQVLVTPADVKLFCRCAISEARMNFYKGRVGNTGIETNSLQHRGDTLQPVFRMSVYNIVRKREVLETSFKSEEVTNFYPIFLCILAL